MPSLFAFFDPSLVVIVLLVIGPSLSIQLPLETAFLLLVTFQFPAEGEQACFSLFSNHGKGGRPQVKTNGSLPDLVLGFLIGNALQGQLSVVAIPLAIGPLSLWARGTPTQQTHKLDGMAQAMLDNRIMPVNESRKTVLLEDQKALIAFGGVVQDKVNALLIGLALDTVQATTTALEANFLGLAQADAIGGLIGTGRELLCGIAIKA